MATKKIRSDAAKDLRGVTDWKKVKAMTDAEIQSAASADPEARELTPQDLLRFKRRSFDSSKTS